MYEIDVKAAPVRSKQAVEHSVEPKILRIQSWRHSFGSTGFRSFRGVVRMATVAAFLIVKNEELVIERCLSMVRDHVDEIVVADTGSTDRTVEIARSLGANVVHFAWIDDFSAARQFALENTTTDWCFWLDADDVVLNPERIRPLVSNAPDDIGVYQWRYVAGRNMDGTPSFSYWRERLVRNDGHAKWWGRIHEVLLCDNGLRSEQTEDVAVEHHPPAGRAGDPGRNLRILEAEYEAAGGNPGSRTLFYLGREYADNGFVDKAIEILTRCGNDDPWSDQRYMAMTQVGQLYIGKGEYVKAIDAYLQALKTFPNWPDAYFGLGHCYYFIQDWCKTIDWIEIARSRPTPVTPLFRNEWKLKIEWLIFYVNALFHVGRQDEAREWTLKALELDPTNHWHLANKNLFDSYENPEPPLIVAEEPAVEAAEIESAAAEPVAAGRVASDAVCLGNDGLVGPC